MNRFLIAVLGIMILITVVLVGYSVFNQNKLQKETTLPVDNKQYQPKQIDIGSEFPGVTMKFTNKNFLAQKLEEVHFWDNFAIIKYANGAQRGLITVDSLELILTDKEQINNHVVTKDKSGKFVTYASYGFIYNSLNRHLKLLLHVDTDYLDKHITSDLNSFMSWMILRDVFDVSHPMHPNDKQFARLKGVDDYAKSIDTLPNNAFVSLSK
jgi:hypothetical protein